MSGEVEMIKVLYVEDDPEDVLLVREYLKQCDGEMFYLESARSVRNAEMCLRVQQYDLILVDYLLGNRCDHVTGTAQQLLQKLCDRKIPIPVILLTGFQRDMLDLQTLSLVSSGRATYLSKAEMTERSLVSSIRAALNRQVSALFLGGQHSDRDMIREAVNLVSPFPVRVDCATSPTEAERHAREHRYQYLFVDSDCDCERPLSHGVNLMHRLLSEQLADSGVLISGKLGERMDFRVHRLIAAGQLSVVARSHLDLPTLVQVLLQTRDKQHEADARAASCNDTGERNSG